MSSLLFEVEGTPCVFPFLFGVDIFNTLITLQRLLLSKNVGMISVCQTSHCLVTTVFFEDLLILTVTGFSDLHSALRQSMHAIIRVAIYIRIARVTAYLIAAPFPNPTPTPLSALRASNRSLYFYADLYACAFSYTPKLFLRCT